FFGTAQPGTNYQTGLTIPSDALSASVQIAWGSLLSTNDLGLSVFDPGGTKRAESNTLNLPGLTGRRERVTITAPAPGPWQARVAHTVGLLATPQAFSGSLEVT